MEKINDKPDFMLSEMLEQPKILDTIANDPNTKNIASQLQESGIKRLFLTGSGDSYCAARFGEYLGEIWNPNYEIRSFAPFEFVNHLDPSKLDQAVVIGLSVSGNSPRTIEAIRYAKKNYANTIGITDNPKGKLADEADQTLFIHASPPKTLETTYYSSEGAKGYIGYHHDVAQTKTYLANIGVLSSLMAHVSQENRNHANELLETVQLVKKAVNQRSEFQSLGKKYGKNLDKVIFVASGPNNSTTLFGAYKMFEFTLDGYASDIEEYCHTKYFITTEKSLVVFLVPNKASLIRVMEIEPIIRDEIKARTVVFSDSSLMEDIHSPYTPIDLPNKIELSPLVLTIPVQFLSYSIAKAQGLDTNNFRGGQETEKYVSGSYKTIRQSKLQY
jgi:glucosamine--fructose-6-phosphate aminotransferase (isomerizing)